MRSTTFQPWHRVVGLCSLGWVLIYAGRGALSPLLGPIGDEWGLNEAQLGLISSLFFLVYAAAQIPAGILADRFGRKRFLVGGLLLLALATALRGLAPSYFALLFFGGLAALGQGTYFSTQFALSSAAIPLSRRGVGSAVIFSGMAVGASLGFILSSFVTFQLSLGWRLPFLILAVPTAAAALLFASLIPERGGEKPAQREIAASPGGHRRALREALAPNLLAVYLLNFTVLYAAFMMLTWLPYYLQTERGLAGTSTGLVASVVHWASIPGAILLSHVSDRLGDRIVPLRFVMPVAALAVMGIAHADAAISLLLLLSVYGFLSRSPDALMVARVADLATSGCSSTALGFLNFSGMVAAVLAPLVTGIMTVALGTMRYSFYLAGIILLLGFVASLLTGMRPRLSQAHCTAQTARGRMYPNDR